MSRLLLTTTAFALTTTAAFAGPVEVPPAPPPVIIPVEEPFEGFYAGLEIGHSMTDDFELDSQEFDIDNGLAWGGFAGYNIQNGNLVAGGEVRFLHFNDFESAGAFIVIEDTIDVRARLGFASGDFMAYGALGYSSVGASSGGVDGDLTGINFGAGAEYNVSERFFVGVDYTGRQVEGTLNGADTEATINTLTVRAGLRF